MNQRYPATVTTTTTRRTLFFFFSSSSSSSSSITTAAVLILVLLLCSMDNVTAKKRKVKAPSNDHHLQDNNSRSSSSSSLSSSSSTVNRFGQAIYPLDTSWAITTPTNLHWGDVQGRYDAFIEGCKEAAGEKKAWNSCVDGEKTRMEMNTDQPSSMRNYTTWGFDKIKTPQALWDAVSEFWETNKDQAEVEWHSYNTYHNMWESPPYLVNVQDPDKYDGAGFALQNLIWETARDVLEEWTGMHLAPCSMWGIRQYRNGSVLATHVDRNPLITSAIINVDQQVDEDWPLEVWGHDGRPYNITMEPGDMVLYESHSILHGRPFPFRGDFYANIFVHFEPLGPKRMDNPNMDELEYDEEALESLDADLPPYVIPGSIWEDRWRNDNPDGWELLHNNAGQAASRGHLYTLQNLRIHDPDRLHQPDGNGWYPIHEAARSGKTDAIKFLLMHGPHVNINELTGSGDQTALSLAKQHLPPEHEMITFLEELGAVEVGPEL